MSGQDTTAAYPKRGRDQLHSSTSIGLEAPQHVRKRPYLSPIPPSGAASQAAAGAGMQLADIAVTEGMRSSPQQQQQQQQQAPHAAATSDHGHYTEVDNTTNEGHAWDGSGEAAHQLVTPQASTLPGEQYAAATSSAAYLAAMPYHATAGQQYSEQQQYYAVQQYGQQSNDAAAAAAAAVAGAQQPQQQQQHFTSPNITVGQACELPSLHLKVALRTWAKLRFPATSKDNGDTVLISDLLKDGGMTCYLAYLKKAVERGLKAITARKYAQELRLFLKQQRAQFETDPLAFHQMIEELSATVAEFRVREKQRKALLQQVAVAPPTNSNAIALTELKRRSGPVKRAAAEALEHKSVKAGGGSGSQDDATPVGTASRRLQMQAAAGAPSPHPAAAAVGAAAAAAAPQYAARPPQWDAATLAAMPREASPPSAPAAAAAQRASPGKQAVVLSATATGPQQLLPMHPSKQQLQEELRRQQQQQEELWRKQREQQQQKRQGQQQQEQWQQQQWQQPQQAMYAEQGWAAQQYSDGYAGAGDVLYTSDLSAGQVAQQGYHTYNAYSDQMPHQADASAAAAAAIEPQHAVRGHGQAAHVSSSAEGQCSFDSSVHASVSAAVSAALSAARILFYVVGQEAPPHVASAADPPAAAAGGDRLPSDHPAASSLHAAAAAAAAAAMLGTQALDTWGMSSGGPGAGQGPSLEPQAPYTAPPARHAPVDRVVADVMLPTAHDPAAAAAPDAAPDTAAAGVYEEVEAGSGDGLVGLLERVAVGMLGSQTDSGALRNLLCAVQELADMRSQQEQQQQDLHTEQQITYSTQQQQDQQQQDQQQQEPAGAGAGVSSVYVQTLMEAAVAAGLLPAGFDLTQLASTADGTSALDMDTAAAAAAGGSAPVSLQPTGQVHRWAKVTAGLTTDDSNASTQQAVPASPAAAAAPPATSEPSFAELLLAAAAASNPGAAGPAPAAAAQAPRGSAAPVGSAHAAILTGSPYTHAGVKFEKGDRDLRQDTPAGPPAAAAAARRSPRSAERPLAPAGWSEALRPLPGAAEGTPAHVQQRQQLQQQGGQVGKAGVGADNELLLQCRKELQALQHMLGVQDNAGA